MTRSLIVLLVTEATALNDRMSQIWGGNCLVKDTVALEDRRLPAIVYVRRTLIKAHVILRMIPTTKGAVDSTAISFQDRLAALPCVFRPSGFVLDEVIVSNRCL